MSVISDAFSDALLRHSTGLFSNFLLPDVLREADARVDDAASRAHAPPPMHETLLIVPSGEHAPLELHIDNCHRRCVALYDTQRILQFGG